MCCRKGILLVRRACSPSKSSVLVHIDNHQYVGVRSHRQLSMRGDGNAAESRQRARGCPGPLRRGCRVGFSDVVADDRLSQEERVERGGWAGCIAGALSQSELISGLEGAGLVDVDVTFTHEVADGLHGAIVKAIKPESTRRELPLVGATSTSAAGCC